MMAEIGSSDVPNGTPITNPGLGERAEQQDQTTSLQPVPPLPPPTISQPDTEMAEIAVRTSVLDLSLS